MYKTTLTVLIVLVSTMNLLAQETREVSLRKLKENRQVQVTEKGRGLIEIRYGNGKVRYKDISDYEEPKGMPAVDSTVIDLIALDTMLYYKKYRFWREVPAHSAEGTAPWIDDVDNDGFPEIYGTEKYYETPSDSQRVKIFSYRSTDSTFRKVYSYSDSSRIMKGITDIDKDGNKEVIITPPGPYSWCSVYSHSNNTGYSTQFNFGYFCRTQLNDPTYGDFNNNGKTDLLYYSLFTTGYTVIAEYDPVNNRMDSVYGFRQDDLYAAGFSHADIDGDGYDDIVEATIYGKIYVISYKPGEGYQNTWEGIAGTKNAYLHTSTKDIDGNGKPEFWVGGDTYVGGIGRTRLTCYEAEGQGNYVEVGRIDLIGVFSFFAGNLLAVDIDKDGKEELGLCIDGRFLILKFTGAPGMHSYEVFFIKKNELDNVNSVYYGGNLYDINSDQKYELIISMDQVIGSPPNDQIRYFTRIYYPDYPVGVTEKGPGIPASVDLYQNYPNPFNPSTIISYTVPVKGFVTLKVYDLFGSEVAALVNRDMEAGNYSAVFNASGLASGIYVYKLQVNEMQLSKKLTLLK